MKEKKSGKIGHRLSGVAFVLALLLCCVGGKATAAEDIAAIPEKAEVVSSRTAEGAVYAYIKNVNGIEKGSTVQIGNTMCEDMQVAGIASMGIPIKTTILFDNSISLSNAWGSQAKELIKGIIGNHVDGEEFKLATFAEKLQIVSDFSSDYEALNAAVDGIEFINQSSYLTDILYDLLKQGGESAEANYMRVIIITDGADDQDIKYTQNELSELLKNSGIVIHTVGAKGYNNSAQLENLFSYSRQSAGTYSLVDASTQAESVRALIDEDYGIYCLRLVPEASVQDGGKREAKFTLNTDAGEVILTATLKMPFGDASSSGKAQETVQPEPSESKEPENIKPSLPTISVEPKQPEVTVPEEKEGFPILWVIIGICALAIIAVVVVVILLLGRKKKGKTEAILTDNRQPDAQSAQGNEPGAQGGNAILNREMAVGEKVSGSNTMRIGGQYNQQNEGHTMRLQGGAVQQAVHQYYITLTDINQPQRTFRVPIDTRIVIGREQGDILLGFDASVSHRHCEIIRKGNLFYVNDLKSSNGTFYGNSRIYGETPIMSGGILGLGTGKYKITIE